jgi:glycine/serine hydroxymethyltransferase
MNPIGIRLGTSAMTTRGFDKEEFTKIASFLNDIVNCCINLQNKYGKKLKEFKDAISHQWPVYVDSNIYGENNADLDIEICNLKSIKYAVNELASKYNFYS